MSRATLDDSQGERKAAGRLMKRMRWGVVGTMLGLSMAVGAGLFQDDDGSTGMFATLMRGIRGKVSDARTSVRNRSLVHQVETRLRQEKNLEAEQIEITVEDETTVVLRGQVVDADDKERAVALARDTRGVMKVIDHLAVPPTARVIDASRVGMDDSQVANQPRTLR